MTVIQVDTLLLRGALADIALRPGSLLGGRVLERHGAHGLLLLAGVPLVAQLPEGVAMGARLRLRVAEATGDRLVLQVLGDGTAAQAAAPAAAPAATPPAATPPAAFALALPGGGCFRLSVDADGDAEEGAAPRARGVSLRWESPALGRMDVRLDGASCAVSVSAGEPEVAVRGAAGELRAALSEAAGHPVLVTVHARAETIDARA